MEIILMKLYLVVIFIDFFVLDKRKYWAARYVFVNVGGVDSWVV